MMHRQRFWVLPFLCFLCSSLVPSASRSITQPINDTSEDVDLEEVLYDYYDNLLELWTQELKKAENDTEQEEEEVSKPKRNQMSPMDYGFMSDDTNMEPSVPDNNTQSRYDFGIPIQIGNMTYRTIPMRIGNVTYRFLNESLAAVLDLHRANRERTTGEDNSTRIKDMRLNAIKESVLSLRGGNSSFSRVYATPKQTKTLTEIFEKQVKESPELSPSNMYAEKYQSFYPSCDIPRNTDESAWSDPHSMNLFFDVYFPTPEKENALMIVNAVLRLYTISQNNFTFPLGNVTIPGLKIQMDRTSVSIPNYSLLAQDDDRRIRISIYWYTKALRGQKSKKKLLDSQMMPLHGEHNLTFNIRAAVRSWKESRKNYGLHVTVEDESGTLLKPKNYIYPMNCSKWAATVRPLPMFGFDSPSQYFIEDPVHFEERNGTVNETNYDDESSHFAIKPVKYPILSLRMREVSLSEIRNLAQLKSAQIDLQSRYLNLTRKNDYTSNESRYRKYGNTTMRITYFENVPLGVPLNLTRPEDSDGKKPKQEGNSEKH